MKLSKQERERRIFEALASLAGMNIVPQSITQPDPPDIVCEIAGQGQRAIELVALDAQATRTRLDNMLTTDEAWGRALSSRSLEEQVQLRADTRSVFFSIAFDNNAGSKDRTAALHAVQRFLLMHPGYKGLLPLGRVGRPRGLGATTLHRGNVTSGPKFSHFSAGRWSPPQISNVVAKLRPGRYQLTMPVELFAYSVHDEPDLAIGSLEQLQEAIVQHLPGSSFSRVHVFDLGFQRYLFRYP